MKQKNPRDTCDTLEIILHVSRVSHVSIALIFLSHTDYADFTEGTCSARAAVRGNAECVWLKDSGGVNSFEELRPERPKAHSPGQGEQRELAPWVCSIPTTWRPERAQALNHTNKYVGLSRIGVELLPFQGATYAWGFCPRVSLLAVACPGLGAIALSGRGMIVHCSTC